MPDEPKQAQKEASAGGRQTNQPKPMEPKAEVRSCQAAMRGKKLDSEHKCTGCGKCGKNNKEAPPTLNVSAGSSLEEGLSLSETSTSLSSEPVAQETELEGGHVCTGCGRCVSNASLKTISDVESSSLQDQQIPSTEPADTFREDPQEPKTEPVGSAGPGTPSFSSTETYFYQERSESPADRNTVPEPIASPETYTYQETQKPQAATITVPDSFASQLFTEKMPENAPPPSQGETEQIPHASGHAHQDPEPSNIQTPDASAPEAKQETPAVAPKNHSHETAPAQKTSAPKKRYVIGTYTYEDILASAWLRKMYGHLVGLSVSEFLPLAQKSPGKDAKKKEEPVPTKATAAKKESKKDNSEKKECKRLPLKPSQKKAKNEQPAESKPLSHKAPLFQKPSLQKLRKELANTTKAVSQLKKESRKLAENLRKFKKDLSLEKAKEAKKAISSKIRKLEEQKSKIDMHIKDAKARLKSLEEKIIIKQAKQLLSKASLKTREAIEKLRKGKPLSISSTKSYTKSELRKLKELLENEKIVKYLLLRFRGKKRKSVLLRRISGLISAIGKLLETK